jgi:rare lipoprotein A
MGSEQCAPVWKWLQIHYRCVWTGGCFFLLVAIGRRPLPPIMKRTSSCFGLWAHAGLAYGLLLALMLSSFAGSSTISPMAQSSSPTVAATASETGIASYYGSKYHGKLTASGEVFNMNDLTAAHPKLNFGTRVKVTHLENNRSVVVRVNDRGPFIKGRVIDLSQAAATALQMERGGLAQVKIEVVE